MPGRPAAACPPSFDRERIEAELARIEATAEFSRAPVMRRLLRFLVETTLQGKGGQLKAYSVAVDGLGRAPDFDAQSDSYPRVQVGRLRRMLHAFYAQHGALGALRLTIPQGAYIVEFADEPPATGEVGAALAPGRRRRQLIGAAVALLALLVLAAAAFAAWRFWPEEDVALRRPADNLSQPPAMTVDVKAMQNARTGLAQATEAFLVDAIRRSRLVRLQPSTGQTAAADEAPAGYRLTGAISGGSQPNLFLRLWRSDMDRLIWSGVVRLPADGGGLQTVLMPALVELGQPFGVIASDQRARHVQDFAPGYACYLQFDNYRRGRDRATHDEVSRCLDATLRTDPKQAVALAAQSFLLIDEVEFFDPVPADREKIARAAALAARAVVLDPYSPDAHFALSRAAFQQGACPRAMQSGRRTIALDPYNPESMARIGRILMDCGDPAGERLIEKAIALDPNPPASFFTPLVLAALARDDLPAAAEVANRMSPPADVTAPLYSLTMALVQAAGGEKEAAAASWKAITDTQPGADADAILARWALTEPQRELALAILQKAELLAQTDAEGTQPGENDTDSKAAAPAPPAAVKPDTSPRSRRTR